VEATVRKRSRGTVLSKPYDTVSKVVCRKTGYQGSDYAGFLVADEGGVIQVKRYETMAGVALAAAPRKGGPAQHPAAALTIPESPIGA
jgi:hypothetical protein